ncbi:choice-of-anchor D domain-containing protein [bacterium]|nr:choice-of-anchor D domain-containing protein [bacterium]
MREAINYANGNSGPDTIRFAIPAQSTINISGALPALTDSYTVIDGHTDLDNIPDIQIAGAAGVDGLIINSSHNVITGLIWSGFEFFNPIQGIAITISSINAHHNRIIGNYIGTDIAGVAAYANRQGVFIDNGAHHNVIGDGTISGRNVISGNVFYGIVMSGIGTDSNVVLGNFIGTDATGISSLGNSEGIFILFGPQGNQIGNGTLSGRNLISGNVSTGIHIEEASNNHVLGNFIGLNLNGDPLGNYVGIGLYSGAKNNRVGDGTAGGRNIISNNSWEGVAISSSGSSSDGNLILGNFIGTDTLGTSAMPNNGNAVSITGGDGGTAHYNFVGDGTVSGRNIISGNAGRGIEINTDSNTVFGNYIGVDVTGNSAMGNTGHGILVTNAYANIIRNNVISDNGSSESFGGGLVLDNAHNHIITGNFIGLNASGTAAIPNRIGGGGGSGLLLDNGSSFNQIGDGTVAGRNVIGDNGSGGDAADNIDVVSGSNHNTFAGNYVGTDITGAVGLASTARVGFYFVNSYRNQIGVPGVDGGNVIAGHASGPGIEFYDADSNEVRNNKIGLAFDGSALGNDIGINIIGGSSHNKIGGNGAGDRNVISSNNSQGISISDIGSDSNYILGNFVGVDPVGTADFGNSLGILIGSGATGNFIGDGQPGGRNIISGSAQEGVLINGADGNFVYGNFIGTDITGTVAIQNNNGVMVQNGNRNIIGDEGPNRGNLISGNNFFGALVYAVFADARDNVVRGNKIGTQMDGISPLPNGIHGIRVYANSGNATNDSIIANTIAFNTSFGIEIEGNGPKADSNIVFKNSIFNNASGGINHVATAQGFVWDPVITTIDIDSTVHGIAASNALVHLYADAGNQGQFYLDTVRASGSGNWARKVPLFAGYNLTALQDSAHNTSRFSAPLAAIVLNPLLVTSLADDSTIGSLRYAIGYANSNSAPDTIRFAAAFTTGDTIYVDKPLPNVTDSLTMIDGGPIKMNIAASGSFTGFSIMSLRAPKITLHNLTFDGRGIAQRAMFFDNAGLGAYFGILENSRVINFTTVGVQGDISWVTIQNNWIAVNGLAGIAPGPFWVVRGNMIGTDETGNADYGVQQIGVALTAYPGTRVGGANVIDRNIISGNDSAGILIDNSQFNMIEGNYIGTNVSGNAAIANETGIRVLNNSHHTQIGSPIAGGGNVIAGNLTYGIYFQNSDTCSVQNNFVGINAAGNTALGNLQDGIGISNSRQTKIGGALPFDRNIISGNADEGIELAGDNNFIVGNYIGTDAAGNAAIANVSGVGVFGKFNKIGDGTASGINVISGNSLTGIYFQNADSNLMSGNFVGVAADGVTPLANLAGGVSIDVNSDRNTIGDTVSNVFTNVISSNVGSGISVSGRKNIVAGNFIGTDSNAVLNLGNTGEGVFVLNGSSVDTIGLNVIAHNGANGLRYDGGATDSNWTYANSIFNNTLSGIAITSGAQQGIAKPVILNLAQDSILSGLAAPNAMIYVFADSSDEGKLFIDTTRANAAGQWFKKVNLGALPIGLDSLTVLQDSSQNSSEFSLPISTIILDPLLVTNTNDAGTGSLRDAITYANSNAGADTIRFALPLIGQTITIISTLNVTDDSTVIDGDIDGDNIPSITIAASVPGFHGIQLSSQRNTIKHLNMVGFGNTNIAAILAVASSYNRIIGNRIGTNLAGTAAGAPNFIGIWLHIGSKYNTIGDTLASGRNIISGNARPIAITFNSDSNLIIGNYIGTDVTGLSPIGNTDWGIELTSTVKHNRIGNGKANGRNIISANTSQGILIGSNSDSNAVIGNYIGVAADGATAMSNSVGIGVMQGSRGNRIGDGTVGGRNIISGNSSNGISLLVDAAQTIIDGNFIGLSTTGLPVGNGFRGVELSSNASGDSVTNNTIAYNGAEGVIIDGATTDSNIVFKNSIFNNGGAGVSVINGGQQGIVPPVITNVFYDSTVVGTGAPNGLIHLYADTTNEGKVFLDSIRADGAGNWSKKVTIFAGMNITALQNVGLNTSAFSNAFQPIVGTIGLTPGSLSFGNVAVGDSVTQIVKIFAATGGMIVSGASLDLGAQYSISGFVIPDTLFSGDTMIVNVKFKPTVFSPTSDTLRLVNNSGLNPLKIALNGTGVSGSLTASVSPMNFSNVVWGDSVQQSVKIYSNGGAVSISGISLKTNNQFRIDSTLGPPTLFTGDTAVVFVTYKPNGFTTHIDTILVANNSGVNPLKIGMSGTGAGGVLATLTPNVYFGTVPVLDSAKMQIHLFVPHGYVQVNSAALKTGSHFQLVPLGTIPAVLGPGDTLKFESKFLPGVVAALFDSVIVNSNSLSAFSVRLDGNSIVPQVTPIRDTLYVIEDAKVMEQQPTTNFGSAGDIYVYGSNANGAGNYPNDQSKAYVKFNLASLPASADILSATLKVSSPNGFAYNYDPYHYAFFVTNDAWTEGSITWNTRPAQGTLLGQWFAWANGFNSWTYTLTSDPLRTQVAAERAGDGILSMAISNETGAYYHYYYSKEGTPNQNLWTQLIVDYLPSTLATLTPIQNMGSVQLGDSTTAVLKVFATAGTVTINAVNLQNGGDYSLNVGGGLPQVLNLNDTMYVTVKFKPTTFGAINDVVDIVNTTGVNPFQITLNGTGVVGTLASNISSINYGNVLVGDSVTQNVKFYTTLGAVAISDTAFNFGTHFSVAGPLTLPDTLFAGDTLTVPVKFRPRNFGALTDTLRVTNNSAASLMKIALNGTGLAGTLATLTPNVNFGSVQIGDSLTQAVKIYPATGGVLVSSANFKFGTQFNIGNALSLPRILYPGDTLFVDVEFKPTLTDTLRDTISIANNSITNPFRINLVARGAVGPIIASQTSINFGGIHIGDSLVTIVKLYPSTIGLLINSASMDFGSQFSLNSTPTLPNAFTIGDTLFMAVKFKPNNFGAFTDTIRVSSNALISPLSIVLNGTGLIGTLATTSTSVNFGVVQIGDSVQQVIKFYTTIGAVNVDSIKLDVNGDFKIVGITPGIPSILKQTDTLQATVKFKPSVLSTRTDSMRLFNNSGTNPFRLFLSGVGNSGTLATLPSSVNFNNVFVGDSAQQTVKVFSASGNITVSAVSLESGTDYQVVSVSSGLPHALPLGDTLLVVVKFKPKNFGSRSDRLVLNNNSLLNPVKINLSGTGTGGTLAFTPAAINFGNVLVTDSAVQTVKLFTTAGSAIVSSGLLDIGNDFTIQSVSGLPDTIATGDTIVAVIKFKPTVFGALSDTIRVSNNSTVDPLKLALTGAGQAGTLASLQSGVDFGSVMIGDSAAMQMKFYAATGQVVIDSVNLRYYDDLKLVNSGLPIVLTANTTDTLLVNVKFIPANYGNKLDTLQIWNNAAVNPFALRLDAFADTNAFPTAFRLKPVDNDNISGSRTPALTWEGRGDDDGDALNYTIQIATANDFLSIVQSLNAVDSMITVPSPLDSAGSYFWRVIASDGLSETYSDTGFFRIDAAQPEMIIAVLTSTVLKNAISIYAQSNEDLDSIAGAYGMHNTSGALTDSAALTLTAVAGQSGVYAMPFVLPSSGSLFLTVTGYDYGGNQTTISRSYNAIITTASAAVALTTRDGAVTLNGAKGSLANDGFILLSQQPKQKPSQLRKSIETNAWTEVGERIDLISTVELKKDKYLQLTVRYSGDALQSLKSRIDDFDERKIGLYFRDNGEWSYLGGEGAEGQITAKLDKFGELAMFYNPEHVFLPKKIELSQNYPNPFNPSTTIRFGLPDEGKVKLTVYNILGQKVKELLSESRNAGYHEVRWDGKNEIGQQVATGVYIYRLETPKEIVAKKMLLVK